eukprot:TRINITY_DN1221_c0_g1_i2.p1 TRINITY_DN1221_c0_g1~~TRINITY_DN1221_c0_g1_i2.p1  ORF type:complete len:152 (+),score=34.29 TRINITY_DN1221_c0_g1_i2:59-514(+)
MASTRRLGKELSELMKEPVEGVSVAANETDMFKWTAQVEGPKGTPYEGGIFAVEVTIPTEYPFKAPSFQFRTVPYHPSVKQDTGDVCSEAIGTGNSWKPSIKIIDILLQVRELLCSPRPENPLEPDIAQQLATDKAAFDKAAVAATAKLAA